MSDTATELDPLPDGVHTNFDYRSDPARLSPNGAKKLLTPGGPARFDWERRHPRKAEPKFDMGKLVHRLVLGAGEEIAPIHFPNYNTKAAQEQRDKAYAEGMIPALTHQFDTAVEMARIVHEHPEAGPLLAGGDAEVWLYATDPETGQKIRLRPDCMNWRDDRLWIIDVKTTGEKADRNTFSRKAYDFGYYLQFAFSVVAARALEIDEQPAMVFIVQELNPPYLVAVHELDADAFRKGRDDMTRAIRIFQECTHTGFWPGFPDDVQPVSLPPWAFRGDWNEPIYDD